MSAVHKKCTSGEQLTALSDISAGRVDPAAPITVRATVLATIPRAHPRCPFVAILGDPASTVPPQSPGSSVRLKVWSPRAAWAEENLAVGDAILAAGCTFRAAARSAYADAPALVLGARATIRKLHAAPAPHPPQPAAAAAPHTAPSPARAHG
jgi:hypothetical protein